MLKQIHWQYSLLAVCLDVIIWKKMKDLRHGRELCHHDLTIWVSHGQLDENCKREQDIRVTRGLLLPEFLTLTPRTLKEFIYTWQLSN